MSLKEIAQLPVEEWNGRMVNDFEESVFPQFPAIGEIKEEMYRQGAVYASMSGSGSSVYGLFKEDAVLPEVDFGEKLLYTKASSLIFKNASTNILISGNKNTTRLFLQKTQNNLDYEKVQILYSGRTTCLAVGVRFAEGRLPANIQTAFQTLYPQATDVEWEQMAGCYVAEFIADGQEIDVWFNKQAEWVMTETDVESLEKVPAPVAEAFMSSTMTGMRLRDIRIITFPKHPTVIIIEVEQYNSDEEFQLFYAPDGKLLQSLDVTELGGEIYPGLFFND